MYDDILGEHEIKVETNRWNFQINDPVLKKKLIDVSQKAKKTGDSLWWAYDIIHENQMENDNRIDHDEYNEMIREHKLYEWHRLMDFMVENFRGKVYKGTLVDYIISLLEDNNKIRDFIKKEFWDFEVNHYKSVSDMTIYVLKRAIEYEKEVCSNCKYKNNKE